MKNIKKQRGRIKRQKQGNSVSPEIPVSSKWRALCSRHILTILKLNPISTQPLSKLLICSLILIFIILPFSHQSAFGESISVNNSFTPYFAELKKDPANPEALQKLITACMNFTDSDSGTGRYKAIEALEQASEIVPNPISIYNLLVNLYSSTYQPQKAREMRKRIHELSKQNLEMPPIFSFTSNLDDTKGGNGNGLLEAGERANLIIAVTNHGKGAGFNVKVNLTSNSSLIPSASEIIDILKVKAIREVSFPINIPEMTKDAALVLDILIEDPRGYKYAKALTHALKGLVAPKLIYRHSFFDNGQASSRGNSDGIVQNGERIALDIEIENTGKGDARDVTCTLKSQDDEIKLLRTREDIGKVPSGEKIKARFLFEATQYFAADKAPIQIDISERHNFGLIDQISLEGGILRPDLSCLHSIDDSQKGNNNQILEAGEQARIVVKAVNSGRGDAIDTTVFLKTDHPLIEVKEESVGLLEKNGAGKEISFPITIPENHKDDLIHLEIMLKDPRGYSSQKEVSLAVKGIIAPDLRYTYRIGDDNKGHSVGNGNSRLENGEKIELRFNLKNYGQGVARDVSLAVSCADDNIRFEKGEVLLGEMQPLDEREARLVFSLSPKYKKDALPLMITVSEKYGFGVSKTEQVPVHLVTPLFSYSFQISDSGTPPNGYNGIIDSNEFIELKFQVKNIGDAPAEGVKISLGKSNQSGVMINKGEENLGNIEPGGELSGALSFTVTQDFQGKEIALPLLISEQYGRDLDDRLQLALGSAQDLKAPEIIIATPGDQTEVEKQLVKLQVEIVDDQALGKKSNVQVRVNQRLLKASAGEFTLKKVVSEKNKNKWLLSAEAPLEEGENSILITALDRVGNQGARRITVFRQKRQTGEQRLRPPEIIIASPKPGEKIKQEKAKLICILKDDISIDRYQIKVNGQIVNISAAEGEYRSVGGIKGDHKQAIAGIHQPFGQKELRIEGYLSLQSGQNVIDVFAYDSDQLLRSANVVVDKIAEWGDVWALIVGVSEYKDKNIPQLKYADADAELFYDFLNSQMGKRIKKENIRLLLNKEATIRNLREGLKIFLNKALEKDLVLIYFAGHGMPEAGRNDEAYLLTYDTELATLASDALPMLELDHIIQNRIYAQKVVMIVDACHSGYLGTEGYKIRGQGHRSVTDNFLNSLAKTTGKVVFTATQKDEYALAGEQYGGGHGAFTHYLLEGLKGAADGLQEKDGIITLEEAFIYTREKVAAATHNKQHPNIKGNYDKDFPLAEVQ